MGKLSSDLVRVPNHDGTVSGPSVPSLSGTVSSARITKKLAKSLRWHGQMPATVILDSELDPLSKVVYGILALETWGPTSYVGMRLIAQLLNVSPQTIMRRLQLLEARGHIEAEKKGNGKRSYYSMKSPVFTERPKKTPAAKGYKRTQANMAALAHKLTRSA